MTTSKHGKMKAVRWEGKDESVSVKEIEIPRIQKPLDAIVRITSAAICGTDLHTYHGRIEMRTPLTFGHENIGVIEEVGSAVTTLQKGDRVVVSGGDFKDDADGDLGIEGLFGVGEYGGEYGTFRQMNGGQAQFMRVPNADVNFLVVPQGDNHELDYILLADVWPTAWFALDAAGQVFGDTVVVFGAGKH
jgi:threonine dehydrogenase-like Zn-dependent dehydrogenase